MGYNKKSILIANRKGYEMNEVLQKYARSKIMIGLTRLNDKQRQLFKHMYSPNDLSKPIDDVVRDMPSDRLDWAMQQVANTKQDK